MDKNLYKIGIFLGLTILIGGFIIKKFLYDLDGVFGFDILSIGCLILGVTLIAYYFTNLKTMPQNEIWWQNYTGYYCLIMAIYILSSIQNIAISIGITAVFLLLIYMKYNKLNKA